jgi:alkanesulfonate monooxygenase SsuD/methylene tetrahydromethanopterin reductase-like flavin-dependent oxidoreductase (luciferase family)
MRQWIRTGVGGYVSLSPDPRPRRDPEAYVEHLLALHPIGSPEECVAHLHNTAEATGIREVLLMVEGIGDPARSRDTVLRLGTEVAPYLR